MCGSFELPAGLTLSNLEGLDNADADVAAPHPGSSLARAFERRMDASLTWAFVAWLRSATRLPIFVKVQYVHYHTYVDIWCDVWFVM